MHCVHLFCYFQVPVEVQEGWELPRYDMTNLYVAEYFNKEVYERVEGGCSSNIFLGFVVATATERDLWG